MSTVVRTLLAQHACTASPVIHDSLQWVHEVGVLFGQSVKMKSIFQDISKSENVNLSKPSDRCVLQGGQYTLVPFVLC